VSNGLTSSTENCRTHTAYCIQNPDRYCEIEERDKERE